MIYLTPCTAEKALWIATSQSKSSRETQRPYRTTRIWAQRQILLAGPSNIQNTAVGRYNIGQRSNCITPVRIYHYDAAPCESCQQPSIIIVKCHAGNGALSGMLLAAPTQRLCNIKCKDVTMGRSYSNHNRHSHRCCQSGWCPILISLRNETVHKRTFGWCHLSELTAADAIWAVIPCKMRCRRIVPLFFWSSSEGVGVGADVDPVVDMKSKSPSSSFRTLSSEGIMSTTGIEYSTSSSFFKLQFCFKNLVPSFEHSVIFSPHQCLIVEIRPRGYRSIPGRTRAMTAATVHATYSFWYTILYVQYYNNNKRLNVHFTIHLM